jgi:hypothetical protein
MNEVGSTKEEEGEGGKCKDLRQKQLAGTAPRNAIVEPVDSLHHETPAQAETPGTGQAVGEERTRGAPRDHRRPNAQIIPARKTRGRKRG